MLLTGTTVVTVKDGGSIMKKKLFLSIIPALLVLSSCRALNAEASVDPLQFKEDTLVHSEIFAGKKLEPRKGVIVDDTGEDPASPAGFTLIPKIGVQYSDLYGGGTKYAIRVVAAIGDTTNLTATWKRGILQPDGTEKTSASFGLSHDVAVTTAYENIKNGEDDYTPATGEGTGFTHYVVYTMYDLPAATDLSGYYLFAELTLSRGGSDDVVSKTAITELKQSDAKKAALPKDKKYFIMGTINSVANSILPLDSSLTDTNKARKTGIDLQANDKFGVYKMDSTSFVFLDNSAANTYDTYYIENDDSLVADYSRVREDGNYTMFVNGEGTYGKFGLHADSGIVTTVKLDVASIWNVGNEKVGVYGFGNGSSLWYPMTLTNGYWQCTTYDVGQYPNLIFGRFDANYDGSLSFDVSWNKTADIEYKHSSSISTDLNRTFRLTSWNGGNWYQQGDEWKEVTVVEHVD